MLAQEFTRLVVILRRGQQGPQSRVSADDVRRVSGSASTDPTTCSSMSISASVARGTSGIGPSRDVGQPDVGSTVLRRQREDEAAA